MLNNIRTVVKGRSNYQLPVYKGLAPTVPPRAWTLRTTSTILAASASRTPRRGAWRAKNTADTSTGRAGVPTSNQTDGADRLWSK